MMLAERSYILQSKAAGLIFLMLMLYCVTATSQNRISTSGIDGLFENTAPAFSEITIYNDHKINNKGGHLQGIQKMRFNGDDYFFMTGSSDAYSYLITVNGNKKQVVEVKKLLDKPFKHAGGFQINDGFMVVGIEDNDAKNRSKVYVWRVDDPEDLPGEPLKIIEREGGYKRATAGCVAVAELEGMIVVAVGDWDTEHLDFYRIEKDELYNPDTKFEQFCSLTAANLDRSGWTDDSWPAYQNVNFFKDSYGNLYLAGLGVDDGKNILDIFKVDTDGLKYFKLKKIIRKGFSGEKGVNFNWGAGICSDGKEIEVLACPAHLEKETIIFISKNKKTE